MSAVHTLTISRDTEFETDYRIECPEVTDACRMWVECDIPGCGSTDAERDHLNVIHGKRHELIASTWSVPTDTCYLLVADEMPDAAVHRRRRSHHPPHRAHPRQHRRRGTARRPAAGPADHRRQPPPPPGQRRAAAGVAGRHHRPDRSGRRRHGRRVPAGRRHRRGGRDVTALRVGSLCSGYGGLEMGAELAFGPLEHVWHGEFDPQASAVLAARWPGVPNLGDISAITAAGLWGALAPIDGLLAGYPCQGESDAGLRRGEDDPRFRWPDVAAAVRALRPRVVVLENVRGHLNRSFPRVVADLAAMRYVGRWRCVRASDAGAAHRRERLFVLAWPEEEAPPRLGGADPVGLTADVALLPSPRASDGRRGGNAEPLVNGRTARDTGPNLADAIVNLLLPTPAAERSGYNRGGAAGRVGPIRPSLDQIDRLLPAPRASDTGTEGLRASGGFRPPLSEVVLPMFPTPVSSLGRGSGFPSPETAAARRDSTERTFGLDDAVALPPTPTARDSTRGAGWGDLPGRPLYETIHRLLPTPTSQNAHGNRNNNRGELLLPGVVETLLPTPKASDGAKGGPNQRGSKGDLALPAAAVASVDAWGPYAPAVERWEAVVGRPAPPPTLVGKAGRAQLSPLFVEWLMGLPAGHVTDVVTKRGDALRILGNGVVPQAAALALSLLTEEPAQPAAVQLDLFAEVAA